jgi:preprotein translocase subunit SecG
MQVLGYLIAGLNLLFAIGLVLAMLFYITEQETGGAGGGWGIVGGRHILTSQSGVATFLDRFITWLAAGFLITAFLTVFVFRM